MEDIEFSHWLSDGNIVYRLEGSEYEPQEFLDSIREPARRVSQGACGAGSSRRAVSHAAISVKLWSPMVCGIGYSR